MIFHKPIPRQERRRIQRLEMKAAEKLEKADVSLVAKIKNILRHSLSEEELNKIGVKTKFKTRNRKLTPYSFISALLMGCFNGGEHVATLEIMCCYLRKWFKIKITPQSLQSKINTKESAAFAKEVFIKIMAYETSKAIAKLTGKSKKKKLKLFRRILIQDSTVISLPEALSKLFVGCGGSASKAAVKCDIIYDLQSHLILRCKCISGRIPDSSTSGDIFSFTEKDDLILRDMGYFNLAHFKIMNDKEIKFISRLKIGVLIYLNENDESPIDIIKYLKSFGGNKKIDITIYVGKKERVPLRLIGIKVPDEVFHSRIEQQKKSRGNKIKPSNDLLTWYGYTLMITNIEKNEIKLSTIMKIYKIRWQIELFFKNMKSQLKVDNFSGENKYRILVFLYLKLILTWITNLLYALMQSIVGEKHIVSQVKFTRWLHLRGDWQEIIATGGFKNLMAAFEIDHDLLLKQVKKKVNSKKQPYFKINQMKKVA